MIRNSVLASLVALALSSSAWAGELDGERTGTPVPAKGTITASGDVLGNTARSEMDSESPSQSHFLYGARFRSFHRGGFGGGFAVGFRSSSFYGGGWGGGWGHGFGGGWGHGFHGGGFSHGFYGGGFPVYTSSYFVGGFRGGYCGW